MPKIVVCNTTPILTLLGIESFDILEKLYGKIIVPNAVFQEIEQGKEKIYKSLTQLEWVEIREVQDKSFVKKLTEYLDAGEAEVIALAKELNADLVIIDEKKGRNFAQLNNLICVGSLGILLKAKENNFIPFLKPLLEKMQTNGIWISEILIKEILEKINEK